jgi:hypothetical protein
MRRYLSFAVPLFALFILACGGMKLRKGYFLDDKRYNYVRLEDFKDRGTRNINHPYEISEADVGTILGMVKIKKGSLFSKETKERDVFNSEAISQLAGPISRALKELTPDKKIGFSYLVKEPRLVIRDDRLSRGSMWVEDGRLHIKFSDLCIKLTGDIHKRGIYEIREANRGRGLYTQLDLLPGQSYGDSTKELVIDLASIGRVTEERLKKEREAKEKGAPTVVRIEPSGQASVKERLKELESLKKEHLITEEEYQKKRAELLNQL